MTNAGSPGRRCCSEKIITDTKNKVGMSCNSRLPMNVSIARALAHDPEKWEPVSRLREARFGGRRKVG
jgi:hypothetical protein